jgi:hypothetical protein
VKRAAITSTLLACVVLAVVGCEGRSTRAPTPTPTPTGPAVVVLTSARPTAQVPQPRLPSATAVRLQVLAVTNPGNQGLDIGVDVEDAATMEHRIHVGDVSLYPSNQPALFALVLHGPAADLVHQAPTVLIVAITPAIAGTPLQSDVSLSLTAELTRL